MLEPSSSICAVASDVRGGASGGGGGVEPAIAGMGPREAGARMLSPFLSSVPSSSGAKGRLRGGEAARSKLRERK